MGKVPEGVRLYIPASHQTKLVNKNNGKSEFEENQLVFSHFLRAVIIQIFDQLRRWCRKKGFVLFVRHTRSYVGLLKVLKNDRKLIAFFASFFEKLFLHFLSTYIFNLLSK